MKCEKCGFENNENAKYCINCGNRMDGKVLCPNCGNSFNKDALKCDKCGYKVPHNPKEKRSGFKDFVNNLDNILNKVFSIVVICLLSISIMLSLIKYTSGNGDYNIPGFGFAYTYLFGNWFLLANTLKSISSGNVGQMVSLILTTAIPFIIVLGNIGVTCFFSIKGIIRISRDLKDNKKCINFKYLFIVYLTNLFCYYSLLGLYPSYSNSGVTSNVYVFSMAESYFSICGAIIFLMLAFECVKAFDKNKISLFIERIVSAISFFLITSIIKSLNEPIFIINNINVNPFYYLMSLVSSLISNTYVDNVTIVLIVFLGLSVIFTFMIYVSVVVYGIFFGTNIFKENNTATKYKIPLYASAFMAMLGITITFIISLVVFGVSSSNYQITYLNSSIELLFKGLILLGCSIASCTILSKYRRSENVAKQTSEIE